MESGRREFLGGLAIGAASFLYDGALWGAGEEEKLIPFLDSPAPNPQRVTLAWDQLTERMTPKEQMFAVQHYNVPDVDAAMWKLDVSGLVSKPRSFSLAELRARPKADHNFTLECSGNPPAGGLIYNAKWTGTPLASLLKDCGIEPQGIEVVFFAADSGTEKIRDAEYKQNFARSLSVEDALNGNAWLAFEMNGQPLEKPHGAPVRLIVPGWYGVACVKWVTRIEVHDRKFQNRFMARDYVTVRGERHGDETIWRETLVGRLNVKSVAARVTRNVRGVLKVAGAAWSDGTPIQSVEVRIDDEPWKPARLAANKEPDTWTFWTFDWANARPGEHTVTSRATDARGRMQPAPDDPFITQKKTRWENNQWAVRKIRIDA